MQRQMNSEDCFKNTAGLAAAAVCTAQESIVWQEIQNMKERLFNMDVKTYIHTLLMTAFHGQDRENTSKWFIPLNGMKVKFNEELQSP